MKTLLETLAEADYAKRALRAHRDAVTQERLEAMNLEEFDAWLTENSRLWNAFVRTSMALIEARRGRGADHEAQQGL